MAQKINLWIQKSSRVFERKLQQYLIILELCKESTDSHDNSLLVADGVTH